MPEAMPIKKDGVSPPSNICKISAKMKRDNFSEKEMQQIAEALGLDLKIILEQKKPE